MRIDTLYLTNFRRFDTLHATFHPQLTVLAGVNGAGKTSILEGLSVAIGSWFLGLSDIPASNIRRDQIRLVHHENEPHQFTIEPQFPCTVAADGQIGTATHWSRSLQSSQGRTTYGEAASIKATAEAAEQKVAAGGEVELPILGYYGTGRLWVQKRASATKRGNLGSRLNAYVDALEPASNGKLFKAWMRREEEAHLQAVEALVAEARSGRRSILDLLSISPTLEALQRTCASVVPGAERLFFSAAQERLILTFGDGTRLPFELLSDGYRNLVAMVADIAWRAIQLNPHLGATAIAKSKGVVLVDEIELHLHPSWQRHVLPRLMQTFPNLQFVVTTHSPIIISSVPAEHLRFLMADGQVQQVGVAKGLTVNAVLTELMGVAERDPEVQTALDRLAALIEQGDASKARPLFDQMRAQLGARDEALGTLEWELRELEAFGA